MISTYSLQLQNNFEMKELNIVWPLFKDPKTKKRCIHNKTHGKKIPGQKTP